MGAMDELINPVVVRHLHDMARALRPTLELSALQAAEKAVMGGRLRQRVDIVRDALLNDLPSSFPDLERVVLDLLDQPKFAGWMIWPTTEFIALRALDSGTEVHFDAGMALLARLTIRLSSEFAVRDMVIARPERALETMRAWTSHDNEHVRRLATEGSRAYLPWAKRVPWLLTHPEATRDIVDATYRDPAEYVRRSVANHVNDLSRVDPVVAARIASRWATDPDANTPWVVRHGLRTLIKRGDPTALAVVGFTGDRLRVDRPRISAHVVPWNGGLTFTANVANDGETAATVAIDYSIGFQRANGSVRPKTFKLGTRHLDPGESVTVRKSHSFRPITTRTYYPGPHYITVQANGTLSPRTNFTLEPAGTSEIIESESPNTKTEERNP